MKLSLRETLIAAEKKSLEARGFYESKQYKLAKNNYVEAALMVIESAKIEKDGSVKENAFKKCKEWFNKAQSIQDQFIDKKDKKEKDEVKDKNRNKLTSQELAILIESSKINNNTYLPFYEDSSVSDSLSDSENYIEDMLELSYKQKEEIPRWIRLSEYYKEDIKVIAEINGRNIKQKSITNCSFIASLIVCAEYERKFNKPILTDKLYPKDKNGKPMVSKIGKYWIKLNINGISRKIIIDEFIPINLMSEPLCSYSKIQGEIWPILFEKAYIKINGGYEFKGSNSSIDLLALTNWIPEQIFLKEEDRDKMFDRLEKGYKQGYCLLTVGSKKLSYNEEKQSGIASLHAYAVLDVKSFKGLKLFKLQNPWGHFRWLGKYSHLDNTNWTPELLNYLKYDITKAQLNDDGSFWMDLDSLYEYFDTIHINWNPNFYPYTFIYHFQWLPNMHTLTDQVNFGYNPQFQLQTKVEEKNKVIWILLSKHMQTDLLNSDYLGLHIFKNSQNSYPIYSHFQPFVKSPYFNHPHILTKFTPELGKNTYNLVVSQKDEIKKANFTMRIFANTYFEFKNIITPKVEKKIISEWDLFSAGGNITSQDFFNNPQYCLITNNNSKIVITLTCKEDLPIGLVLFKGKKLITDLKSNEVFLQSETYLNKLVQLNVDLDPKVPNYVIIPTLYEAGQTGKYEMVVYSEQPVELKLLAKEGAGLFHRSLEGKFLDTTSYQIELNLKDHTFLMLRLQARDIYMNYLPIKIEIWDENVKLVESPEFIKCAQGVLLKHKIQINSVKFYAKATPLLTKKFCIKLITKTPALANWKLNIFSDEIIEFSNPL